jgi:hypothetical protein
MDWNAVRRVARGRSRHLEESDSRVLLHWRSEYDQSVQTIRILRSEGHPGGDQVSLVAEVCPLAWLPAGAAQRASRHLKFSALHAIQGMWVLRRIVPLARVEAGEIDSLLDWLVYEANWVRKHGGAYRSDARPLRRFATSV